MTTNRKLVLMVVMLVVVALAMSPAVNAKGGGAITLSRGSHDLKAAGARPTAFGNGSGATTAEICASGSCDCSTCYCYGTLDCCIAGCEACWDYRDGRGYCGI
jgi:hypothetical protein